MREFRRFLDKFVLYTNNPKEIEILTQKKDAFKPLCVYTAVDSEKCIGVEFLFKLPPGIPQTLVSARRFIERRLKTWR